MKIGFILWRRRPSRGSWFPEVIRLLRCWGITVDEIYPNEGVIDLSQIRVEHDLYVLKPSDSDLALSYAGILHGLGARILNPYPVVAALRDKVVATHTLQLAGLPVPQTAAVSEPEHLDDLLKGGPVVLKPYRGSLGRGVRVVRTPAEAESFKGVHLAQRYHPPDGRDRKLYSIGGQIFGVLRTFPATTCDEKVGTPFTVDAELWEIAKRCGQAFGIDTFGVDVIISDGRPYVVDMSAFPGFKGVPQAALRIADYVSGLPQCAGAARGPSTQPVSEES